MNGFEKSRAAPGPMTSSICHAARVDAARIAGYLKSWNISRRLLTLRKAETARRPAPGRRTSARRARRPAGPGWLNDYASSITPFCGRALFRPCPPFDGWQWEQPLEKALGRTVGT